jgi:hypothetical protein
VGHSDRCEEAYEKGAVFETLDDRELANECRLLNFASHHARLEEV